MTDLPQEYMLTEEIKKRIPFEDPRIEAVYMRLGLELWSVGYRAQDAALFLEEAWTAALLDCECQ